MMTTQIIILAAGRSMRMGTQHKLLLPLAGKPMIHHVVSMASEIIHRPIVITGYQSEAVQAACEGVACRFVHNADYAEGMSRSLKLGIAGLDDKTSGVLVLLGDMPMVRAEDCRALLAKAYAHPESVIRACDGEKAGNPVFLPPHLFPSLNNIEGDVGAQSVIKQLGLETLFLDIGPAALMDADTPRAYEALQEHF